MRSGCEVHRVARMESGEGHTQRRCGVKVLAGLGVGVRDWSGSETLG